VRKIAVRSWTEVSNLPSETREELAFGHAVLVFPNGKRYRRETGPRLDMHFVIDLKGDERHVHDLFVNVENRADLYCLRCGTLDGARLDEEYQRRSGEAVP
jgi:hypothetical protein